MSSLCSVFAVFSHACSGIAGPGKRLRTEFFAEKRKVHTSAAAIARRCFPELGDPVFVGPQEITGPRVIRTPPGQRAR